MGKTDRSDRRCQKQTQVSGWPSDLCHFCGKRLATELDNQVAREGEGINACWRRLCASAATCLPVEDAYRRLFRHIADCLESMTMPTVASVQAALANEEIPQEKSQ